MYEYHSMWVSSTLIQFFLNLLKFFINTKNIVKFFFFFHVFFFPHSFFNEPCFLLSFIKKLNIFLIIWSHEKINNIIR
jgi:hypothetical protein